MPMSDSDRNDATRRLGSRMFPPGITATLNTANLKAAIVAIDTTLEVAMSTLNTAQSMELALNTGLPEPFKSIATVAQKAAALGETVNKKFIG